MLQELKLNKGKSQMMNKTHHTPNACERTAHLVISIKNNPIGTVKTISRQNFCADFNDLYLVLSMF